MKTLILILLLAVAFTTCQKEEVYCWECYKEAFLDGESTGTKLLYEGCMTESEIRLLYPTDTIFVNDSYMIVETCKIK